MQKYKQIKTITRLSETKYKEKGSVFLGKAFPISSVEQCEEILSGLKKEFYDATHYCYAFNLLNGKFKYSDDSEPTGTAGIRIYNALEHFELIEVLVVVIRYFGGVKLGVGPLGKAYYTSAFQTLEASEIVVKKPFIKVSISADFPLLSNVHRILSNHNAVIKETNYDSKANFIILAEVNEVKSIKRELTEMSRGEISIEEYKEIEYV